MKKTFFLIPASLIIIMLLPSCKARMLDFTIISSKNVELNVKKDAPRVIGKSSSTIKGAVDNAIEKAGTGYDAIIDGVIYSHVYYVVIFAVVRYHVEGTPIKTSQKKKTLKIEDL